jgi:stress-induced morphogen
MTMTTRRERITTILRQRFGPVLLQVQDDSAQHAGHAGAAPGGETHYSVLMVSESFQGQTRIARSRAVHAVLDGELAGGLHALALTLRTPEEHAKAAAVRPPG